jgi:hypothetical protein
MFLPSKRSFADHGQPYRQAEERRNSQTTDRREGERAGKLDRRKNRCQHCQQFLAETTDDGFCPHHQVLLPATAYACLAFAPLPQG